MFTAPDTLVLASGSPRRRELLQAAGFQVDVRAADADESWPGGDIGEGARKLARRKLDEARAQAPAEGLPWLAADTIVALGDEPLGKPRDRAHAIETLLRLADREHRVITGVCVASGEHVVDWSVETRVLFRRLSAAEIEAYVDCGECFDKAGAYGIQGRGGALVDAVHGSYTNVVGLPLAEVVEVLRGLP